jgi:hypothetical protein
MDSLGMAHLRRPRDTVTYMSDPPSGQGRWDTTDTRAPAMHTLGAVMFTFATIIYCLRIFTRCYLTQVSMRLDDCRLPGLQANMRRLADTFQSDLVGISVIMCWCFYAVTTCSMFVPLLDM